MTFSRYRNKAKILNNLEQYSQVFDRKEIEHINQYSSSSRGINKKFKFNSFEYEWKNGDRLYKLSQKFFNDARLWWVIAGINSKPTDADYEPGDIIMIPTNDSLNEAIKYLGY